MPFIIETDDTSSVTCSSTSGDGWTSYCPACAGSARSHAGNASARPGSTTCSATTTLKGVLGKSKGRDRYAMCGTAAPDAKSFQRVLCSAKHSWRAIDVVVFREGKYPGEKKVRAAGRAQCEDAAADVAEDPLVFEWGYEWPTAEQWSMGQAFGRCWAPD